jgi:hypothetical protein
VGDLNVSIARRVDELDVEALNRVAVKVGFVRRDGTLVLKQLNNLSRIGDSTHFVPRSIDRGNDAQASSPQGHPVKEHLLTGSISRRGPFGASLQVLQ